MVRTKRFILKDSYDGHPKESDFMLVEGVLPELNQGDILVEAIYLSVDPYMRTLLDILPPGETLIGSQVGKIVKSKHPEFPKGSLIMGYFGWCTHTVAHPTKPPVEGFPAPYLLPNFKDLPASLALGVLGMPGNTAYFGLLEICKPKKGETVVVSGAAGAVGTVAGQIAKIKKCRVVGIVDTPAKAMWLTSQLGFDGAVNKKSKDLAGALKSAAPKGVDCYFDNVGGEISSIVLSQMNPRGRIAVSGSISSFEKDGTGLAPVVQPAMISNELMMEGFNVHRWEDRWKEGIDANMKWIREGKMKYPEFITKGFEKMPKAFIGMLRGENTGKCIVTI